MATEVRHVSDSIVCLRRALEERLPVCTTCRRIRDRCQAWQTLGQYMGGDASAVERLVCPECEAAFVEGARKPDLFERR